MHTRRILIGALAAPVFVLSACGGDDSVADPPVSSAPTSSASTDPPQQESAEHFIRRWAVEDTRIQRTGETDKFRAMSKECKGCIKLADLVDRIYRNGGYIHTKGWRVKRITASGGHTYDLYVFSTATTYAESESGSVHHLASGPAHFQLKLIPTHTSWRVSSLVQISA